MHNSNDYDGSKNNFPQYRETKDIGFYCDDHSTKGAHSPLDFIVFYRYKTFYRHTYNRHRTTILDNGGSRDGDLERSNRLRKRVCKKTRHGTGEGLEILTTQRPRREKKSRTHNESIWCRKLSRRK